jgi:AraC-like DNA-binding protein
MIKAAELLVETNKTIKEIARATGYKYRSNFISAFTGYHGLPPSKYRVFLKK